MHICFLGESRSVHVKRWATWFANRGHKVDLLTLGVDPIQNVRLIRLPFSERGALAMPIKASAVRRLIGRLNPDLVHAHQVVGFGLWGAVAGRHPYVVSAWGSDVLVRPQESFVQSLVLRYVLRKADFIIPVARHLENRMLRYGLRLDKSESIPMGVDLNRHPPMTFTRGQRPLVFVSTRSLEPIYDIATLVRAARRVFDANPRIVGQILGDGSLRNNLEMLARREGIGDRLRFEGTVDSERLMESLGNARIYVSTSHSDGASVSLLEAMSRGCYPIVTDIPANREWIVAGENGDLFPVGDAASLAARILEAMTDDAMLERASLTNNKVVQERGDLDKNMTRVNAIYEGLVRRLAED